MPELTKLGKYEIKRELGKGAMGVVYEGFDPDIERTVAIKTVLKSLLDSSEAQNMLNRFRREAQAAGRLNHPNIIPIYEYGEDQDMAFIAMEFIHGKELKKYFDSGERFLMKDVLRIMSQLLEALDYSHARGVVHRDIKPANVIITDDGQVKVADFGIARIESSNLTQVGAVLGTPTHMSPEQFMGFTVDRRTDIYSSGVILYQFLTGEKPFTGTVVAIMHKALNQEPVPPSALNFSVSRAIDDIVKKAMDKRPEDRFQTAREFMEALKMAYGSSPVAATEISDPDATFVSLGTTNPDQDMASLDLTTIHADPNLWKSIGNSQNLGDFQRYLKKYPVGEFADSAKLRIAALEEKAETKAEARRKKVESNEQDLLQTGVAARVTRPDQIMVTADVENKPPVLAIAGSVAVFVIGLGIWLAMRTSPEPTPIAITPATPMIQPQALPAPVEPPAAQVVSVPVAPDKPEHSKETPYLGADNGKVPADAELKAEAEIKRIAEVKAEAKYRPRLTAIAKPEAKAETESLTKTQTDDLIRFGIGDKKRSN